MLVIFKVLERVGEGRIMLDLMKKDALEGMVNRKKVRGRRRYQMLDNIMINGLYADTKRKAEKRVEWRILSLLQKDLPLGRTL